MAKNYPITEFDILTVNPATQMLKAMIPFLDYPIQRQFSLFVRIDELWQTIRFLRNPHSISAFSAQIRDTAQTPIRSLNDILNNDTLLDKLLVYCPENYASMINGFRQFSKMSELMNLFNAFGDSASDSPNPSADYSQLFSLLGNLSNMPGQSHTADSRSNSSPPDNTGASFDAGLFNSFMKPEQQALYDEYIRQLNSLNFDDPANGKDLKNEE